MRTSAPEPPQSRKQAAKLAEEFYFPPWENELAWETRWPGSSQSTKVHKDADPFSNPDMTQPENVNAPVKTNPSPRLFSAEFGDNKSGANIVSLKTDAKTGFMYWQPGQGDIDEIVPHRKWRKETNRSILTNAIKHVRPESSASEKTTKLVKSVRYIPGNLKATPFCGI